jgi:hypothetical protein
MDDPDVDPRQRQAALEGLDRLNRWPGQRVPVLKGLSRLLGPPTGGTRRLVELGAGSGALARWLAPRLEGLGHRVEVLATDLSAAEGVQVLDALGPSLPEADIYFSNLMLHHLDDAAVSSMLAAQARRSRIGFAHFDLRRHWLHYYGAAVLLRLSRMPDIIVQDGARSIQQGFTRGELLALGAGLDVRVRAQGLFRWMLSWRRA